MSTQRVLAGTLCAIVNSRYYRGLGDAFFQTVVVYVGDVLATSFSRLEASGLY